MVLSYTQNFDSCIIPNVERITLSLGITLSWISGLYYSPLTLFIVPEFDSGSALPTI